MHWSPVVWFGFAVGISYPHPPRSHWTGQPVVRVHSFFTHFSYGRLCTRFLQRAAAAWGQDAKWQRLPSFVQLYAARSAPFIHLIRGCLESSSKHLVISRCWVIFRGSVGEPLYVCTGGTSAVPWTCVRLTMPGEAPKLGWWLLMSF